MPIRIRIPELHLFNEATNEFFDIRETYLTMEHSLVSISKWESKWHIPYLAPGEKTPEQALDYLRCMTITQNIQPGIYNYIPDTEMRRIKNYIEDSMSAYKFKEEEGKGRTKKAITSDYLYFCMVTYRIPVEFERWHLNRLITLIQICSEENNPKKNKKSKRRITSDYAALNAARRAKLGTTG